MTRTRNFIARAAVTSMIAGAAIAVSAGPANAATNYWGAIAISQRTGNVGYAWDHATSAGAANTAVSKCNASDCQAVVRVANGCAAVAQAPNRAWGWAWAGSRAEAERGAIKGTPAPGARIIGYVCTTGHR